VELLLFGEKGWGEELAAGLAVTLELAVSSYVLAFFLGLVLSFFAASRSRALRGVWRVYASIMMGVPSLLIVFLVFYNLPLLIGGLIGRPVEISQLAAGIVALTVVYGAYLAEIFRGAINAIPRGQFEAGRALGIHTLLLFRKIILPQVWRLALPGLSNIWLVVLKDTVLVSLVGLTDIVRVANVASGNTGQPFLFYIAVGLVFVVLAIASQTLVQSLEARLERPYLRAGSRAAGGRS